MVKVSTYASALLAAVLAASSRAAVVINEIHCAPADKTVREEFVELHNALQPSISRAGSSPTASPSRSPRAR